MPQIIDLGTIRAQNNAVFQLNIYDPYPNTGPKRFSASAEDMWMPWTQYYVGDWVLYFYQGAYFYNGKWDASTNTPYLQNGQYVGITAGALYVVSEPGTQNLGNGPTNFQIGDILYYDGSIWKQYYGRDYSFICTETHQSNGVFDLTKFQKNNLPPYFNIDGYSGAFYATLPYLPIYSKTYPFTLRIDKQDLEHNAKIFVNQKFILTIRGQVDNAITFETDSNLGNLNVGYLSELSIKAIHANQNISTHYSITGGSLPPGLTLASDGSIVGRIEYGTVLGIYNFTVQATDLYQQIVEKSFNINVTQYDNKEYTQIYVRPFLTRTSKNAYDVFITDTQIFDRNIIYRPDDPDFGVQRIPKIYIEHGIQQGNYSDYFAMAPYFHTKKIYMGDLQIRDAKDEAGNYICDVIYVKITDETATGSVTIGNQIAYPNSIVNMKNSLESMQINGSVVTTDEFQVPRWMRTNKAEQGAISAYIPALVICFTLPNMGESVLKKIVDSRFDFKTLDFEVDRLIIEHTLDNNQSQYLIFNDRP